MRCDRFALAREAGLWEEWSGTVDAAGQAFWLPVASGGSPNGVEVVAAVRAQADERRRAADDVARSLRSFAADMGAADRGVARLFGTSGAWCVPLVGVRR